MKKIFCAALPLLMLIGCATHPNNIEPIATDRPCTSRDLDRLEELRKEQKRAANTDAIGVFMIGLPIGSMNGPDHKQEIAQIMGACHISKGYMRNQAKASATSSKPKSNTVDRATRTRDYQ